VTAFIARQLGASAAELGKRLADEACSRQEIAEYAVAWARETAAVYQAVGDVSEARLVAFHPDDFDMIRRALGDAASYQAAIAGGGCPGAGRAAALTWRREYQELAARLASGEAADASGGPGGGDIAGECPGCVGRGTGERCCVCGKPIPPRLRLSQGHPSELRPDCLDCQAGRVHTHRGGDV
jgi:hypothetical protein